MTFITHLHTRIYRHTHTSIHQCLANRRNGETRHKSLVGRGRGRLFVEKEGLTHHK